MGWVLCYIETKQECLIEINHEWWRGYNSLASVLVCFLKVKQVNILNGLNICTILL